MNLIIASLCTLWFQAGISASEIQWKKYEHEAYSIEYPEDWTLDNSGDSGTSFVLYSPRTNEEDTYSDYISLTEMPLYGLNMKLDDYAKSSENDFRFFYKDCQITRNEFIQKSGARCHVIELNGVFNEFPMQILQYTWIKDEKAYVLKFTGEPSSYEDWKEISMKAMDSFTFIKPSGK